MSISEGPVRRDDSTAPEDAISIPLYLSGLAVSVLGILAVNSSLSDTQIGTTTMVLTLLGFVFSIGCRWLQIKARIVEVFMLCVCLFFAYRFATHSIDLQFFVPPDVSQPDLVIAVVLIWLTVVRSWVLTNDDSVIFTAVTSIAMIGLVGASTLNDELLVYFFGFVVCATFMLLHQTYLTQRSWYTARTTVAKESGVISLQATVALLTAIIAIIVATVLVVPLRAIGSHLSLAGALKNFINGQHSSGNTPAGPGVSLSDDSSFRVGTGSGFSSSDTIVLHVSPNDGKGHYYRGRTYDTYEGNQWISSSQNDENELTPDGSHGFDADEMHFKLNSPGESGADQSEVGLNSNRALPYISARFALTGAVSDMLYVPYGTNSITLENVGGIGVAQSADNSLTLSTQVQDGFVYRAFSNDPLVDDPSVLRSSSTTCPDWLKRQYIDQKSQDVVSISDQERLALTARQIVDRLPKNHRTNYDIASAIREWVSNRCLYSLDVSAVPSGDDAVSYFLFDSRKGYCDLFASSMAVLCRYAGLPSRVATGFDSGTQNDRGGYDLRVRDKHAWVEVWFNGYGWQLFDPTEGSAQDTTSSSTGFKFGAGWILNALTRLRLFLEINGELPIVIFVCVVLGLIYVFKVEVIDKRLNRRGLLGSTANYRNLDAALKVSRDAAAQFAKSSVRLRYQEFEDIIKGVGVKRNPDQTPLEFLETLRAALASVIDEYLPNRADILNAAGQLTNDVMQASYAPLELVGENLIELEISGTGAAALKVIQINAHAIRGALKRSKKDLARR